MKPSVALVLLLLAVPLHAGTLYRWVDPDGKVQYSDKPPPPSAKDVQQKQLGAPAADTGRLPYATQIAAKNFPVTLYVTDCGEACTKARELLRKRGIPYAEKNPQQPAEQEELSKLLSGQLEVPVLKVGTSLVRGFEPGQWNSTLDMAGYPENAGAPPPPPQPAAKPAAPQEPAPAEPPGGEPPAEAQPPQEAAPVPRGPYPAYQ